MKTTRRYFPTTTVAVKILGAQVAEARRLRRWTAADMAERLNVSVPTLRRIENGEPTVSVGLMFEAAVLCGVELFSADPVHLPQYRELTRLRLAVMPKRVRTPPPVVDDNF